MLKESERGIGLNNDAMFSTDANQTKGIIKRKVSCTVRLMIFWLSVTFEVVR